MAAVALVMEEEDMEMAAVVLTVEVVAVVIILWSSRWRRQPRF